jgi:hypothetical protein
MLTSMFTGHKSLHFLAIALYVNMVNFPPTLIYTVSLNKQYSTYSTIPVVGTLENVHNVHEVH